MREGKGIALLPIGVFLVLYLGLGILFEYVMEIPMGFYNVPIVVAFLAAILVACLQNRALNFDQKLEIMAQGVGDKNIITMLLIFLAAGSFVGVVGRSSAESVAYCMLSLIPARFSVAVLFIVGCFVSVAMGTSVGTITLLTPIAVAVSTASGFDLAFCVASVMGGAMFGDNLSFISDTTIAAWTGMRDERQVQGKLLDCFSGSCCDTDSYSGTIFPDRNSGACDSAIPFDAGDSVCARTDRRHCRYQCICCTADRYCVRCVDYADWWPYRSCRDS